MPMNTFTAPDSLRAEIAAAAARLIAEEGADYHSAKRKAAQQILGNHKPKGNYLPDNNEIEDQVREYNELFFADTQPARLQHLRQTALAFMQEIAHFHPYIAGAVCNGTAGEHSDIHLQLFVDSTKDVEIDLLNRHIDFDLSENNRGNKAAPLETLSFIWRNEGFHLDLYDSSGQRQLSNQARSQRLDANGLRALLASSTASATNSPAAAHE